MRIQQEKGIGLAIDIQDRLLPHIHQHEAMLERIGILLKGLQILGIPVLITEQYPKGLGPTNEAVRQKLKPFNPIEKMAFSCCGEDRFMRAVEEAGKRVVIICGIETHVCVLQTALDLIQEGYMPVIISDCVSSRRPLDKETALERMRQEGAIISTSESILFELVNVAGTDTFKQISKLVK
jgi:nicotinamidase-related amidase